MGMGLCSSTTHEYNDVVFDTDRNIVCADTNGTLRSGHHVHDGGVRWKRANPLHVVGEI